MKRILMIVAVASLAALSLAGSPPIAAGAPHELGPPVALKERDSGDLMALDINSIIDGAIGAASLLIPVFGEAAHSAVERPVTIPHAKIEAACHARGIKDQETIERAYKCFQQMADGLSDGVVLIASGGKIQPD